MDATDCDNYELDVKKTLISNIPFIMYVLLIGVFVIKCVGILETLESQETKLLGAIIYMFSVVRLMSWSVGMHNLEYRPIVSIKSEFDKHIQQTVKKKI